MVGVPTNTADVVTVVIVDDCSSCPVVTFDKSMQIALERCTYDNLKAQFDAKGQSDVLLAPLMGGHLDGLELAKLLDGWGYRGHLMLYNRPLPDPHLILKELKAARRAEMVISLLAYDGSLTLLNAA